MRIHLLPLLLAISGCAALSKTPGEPSPAAPDPLIHMLAELAIDTKESLRILAETNNALANRALTPDEQRSALQAAAYTPASMDRKISLKWDGPLEGAVKELARLTRYKVQVFGTSPRPPVLVRVNTKRQPAIAILRDIAYQAGDRATVTVVERGRIIHVGYKS